MIAVMPFCTCSTSQKEQMGDNAKAQIGERSPAHGTAGGSRTGAVCAKVRQRGLGATRRRQAASRAGRSKGSRTAGLPWTSLHEGVLLRLDKKDLALHNRSSGDPSGPQLARRTNRQNSWAEVADEGACCL
jgi:hypothetical protein